MSLVDTITIEGIVVIANNMYEKLSTHETLQQLFSAHGGNADSFRAMFRRLFTEILVSEVPTYHLIVELRKIHAGMHITQEVVHQWMGIFRESLEECTTSKKFVADCMSRLHSIIGLMVV